MEIPTFTLTLAYPTPDPWGFWNPWQSLSTIWSISDSPVSGSSSDTIVIECTMYLSDFGLVHGHWQFWCAQCTPQPILVLQHNEAQFVGIQRLVMEGRMNLNYIISHLSPCLLTTHQGYSHPFPAWPSALQHFCRRGIDCGNWVRKISSQSSQHSGQKRAKQVEERLSETQKLHILK